VIGWRSGAALAAATACLASACAGAAPSGAGSPPRTPGGPPATPAPSRSPAERLVAADAALRASLSVWLASDPRLHGSPPPAVTAAAAGERGIVHRMVVDRRFATQTLAALTGRLRASIRGDVAAGRDLLRLTGPPGAGRLRLAAPVAAGALLADYRLAQRRFGVPWSTLAAVNLVESAFGRVTNRSAAGAQGPMQFLPATWRAYGLGGNVDSPRDAILGAANYLHLSGAPARPRRALLAYNPSPLYVEAVLLYARAIAHDRLGFLTYYAWEASLPASVRG